MRREAPLWVRLFLLLLLPLLAGLLYWRGQIYDPALLSFKGGGGSLVALLPDQVSPWQRVAAVRSFSKSNLYEYINGHAEYFLSAGFRALTVLEYRLPGDGQQPSAVVDVYDMGEPLNAFGVLVDEVGGGQSLPLGDGAFGGPRSLGFLSGHYYVKLAAFADGVPLHTLAEGVLQGLRKGSEGAGMLSLDGLFLEMGKVLATRFVKENYRGWSFLQRVVERRFQRPDGQEGTQFALVVSAEQQAGLEQALRSFCAQEGMAIQESVVAGWRVLQMHDPYEGDWLVVMMPGQWLGLFQPLDEGLEEALKRFARHG